MSVNIYDGTNDELNQIAGREDTSYWEGTQAQWNALSSADKALWTGKYVIITDDAEDASTLTVTFTSNDVANTDTTKTDSGWTNTEILTSGETLPNICTKVSNMFKNIRRLWQTVGESSLTSGKTLTGLMGNTAIPSGLGSTVTGAIDSLNSNYANFASFSSNEKAVGTWVDGKTLYRKTLTAPNGTGTDLTINVSSLNIDTIMFDLSHTFIKRHSVANYDYVTNGITAFTSNILADILYYSGEIHIRTNYTANSEGIIQGYITILYTKS